mgnify:CR=1 FL=1
MPFVVLYFLPINQCLLPPDKSHKYITLFICFYKFCTLLLLFDKSSNRHCKQPPPL